MSDDCRVIADDGRFVEPGSGEVGVVALRGRTPIGYYKDEEKSAKTFRVIDGVRWSIPGDFASIDADGTLVLLGRGSGCINTGGEKVFAEEVEEVLKGHAAVARRRRGRRARPPLRRGDHRGRRAGARPRARGRRLIGEVKGPLASYKAPRQVFVVDSLARKPNGKVDHQRWRDYAATRSRES